MIIKYISHNSCKMIYQKSKKKKIICDLISFLVFLDIFYTWKWFWINVFCQIKETSCDQINKWKIIKKYTVSWILIIFNPFLPKGWKM